LLCLFPRLPASLLLFSQFLALTISAQLSIASSSSIEWVQQLSLYTPPSPANRFGPKRTSLPVAHDLATTFSHRFVNTCCDPKLRILYENGCAQCRPLEGYTYNLGFPPPADRCSSGLMITHDTPGANFLETLSRPRSPYQPGCPY